MQTKKPWFKSTTLWGILIALGGTLLSNFGVSTPDLNLPPNADAETIQAIIAQIKAAHGSLTGILGVVIASIGTLAAIYGRITAKQAIGTP